MKLEDIRLQTTIGSRTIADAFAQGLQDRQIAARLQMEGARDESEQIQEKVAELRNWYHHQPVAA